MRQLKKRSKAKSSILWHPMYSATMQEHSHPMTNLFQHVLPNLRRDSSQRPLIRRMMILLVRAMHKYKQARVVQVHRPRIVLGFQHLQRLRYRHKQHQRLPMGHHYIHHLNINQQHQHPPLMVTRHNLAIVWPHKLLPRQHKSIQQEAHWMKEPYQMQIKAPMYLHLNILERHLITPLSLQLRSTLLFHRQMIYLLHHQPQHLLLDQQTIHLFHHLHHLHQ